MNINLNSSAEEIMAYLNLRGRIQLLNGQFFSTLWVPSESVESVKKLIIDNVDKWSYEKEHQEPETFDFYEALRRMIAGEALEWSETGYIYFVAGSRFMFRTNGERPHELAPLNINATHFKHGRWSVYKSQPKTFGWDEAYRLMKEGKKVAKKSWTDEKHYFFWCGRAVCMPNGSPISMLESHLEATDYYVYEE